MLLLKGFAYESILFSNKQAVVLNSAGITDSFVNLMTKYPWAFHMKIYVSSKLCMRF